MSAGGTLFPFLGIRDLSEISSGGGGGGWWKQREGHNFLRLRKREGSRKWAVIRGRVTQICVRDHVEVHPQKKNEVLYFVKNTLGEIGESSDQLSESESDS